MHVPPFGLYGNAESKIFLYIFIHLSGVNYKCGVVVWQPVLYRKQETDYNGHCIYNFLKGSVKMQKRRGAEVLAVFALSAVLSLAGAYTAKAADAS